MAEMWRWGCGWGGSAREAAAMLGARFRAWFWRGVAGQGHWLLGPAGSGLCDLEAHEYFEAGWTDGGTNTAARSPAAGAFGGLCLRETWKM